MTFHKPVLLSEVINWLITDKKGIYVDCTLGHGGHAENLLSNLEDSSQFIGIDQDAQSLSVAKTRLKKFSNIKVSFIEDNFVNLQKILLSLNSLPITGVFYDLGFSTGQIYPNYRGFSYHSDAHLDMRMNPKSSLTSAEIVNNYSEKELANIFHRYGEEKYAKIIAQNIVKERNNKRIESTLSLVELIRKSLPSSVIRQKHPARKIFQALRIAVNNELEVLHKSLIQAINLLKIGGRIVIISFHSLEDRIIKNVFKMAKNIKILTKTPIRPSQEEQKNNHSSRSAKLRIVEKIYD